MHPFYFLYNAFPCYFSSSFSGGALRAGGGGANDLFLAEEGQHLGSTGLPPKWVDDVDTIHTILNDIRRMIGTLNSLHASRLGSVFGKDLETQEREIEDMTLNITRSFRESERLLQKVGRATKSSGGEEAKVGANVQRDLAKKLQELSAEFRQKQRKYLKDVQLQKNGGVSESESKFGIDLDANHADQSSLMYGDSEQQRLAVVDDLQQAVQSRDQEIAKIAESIEELSSIFKELAVLVIDQGTILDRIDYNMETVVEHTREGIQQLEKAETQQKSARPMKCIMCLLSVIAVLLIILIMKHWH
jgi:syntaxin 16